MRPHSRGRFGREGDSRGRVRRAGGDENSRGAATETRPRGRCWFGCARDRVYASKSITRTYAELGLCEAADALRPVIGKEFWLPEAAKAHRVVLEPGAFGKVILVPDERSA